MTSGDFFVGQIVIVNKKFTRDGNTFYPGAKGVVHDVKRLAVNVHWEDHDIEDYELYWWVDKENLVNNQTPNWKRRLE